MIAPIGSPPTILVVDDDPGIRDLLRDALEGEGLAVESASDGYQALIQAARHRPAVVLLDVSLPGLNGDVVAKVLDEFAGYHVPIILISAEPSALARARRRTSAGPYFLKPFDLDALVKTVLLLVADASPGSHGTGPAACFLSPTTWGMRDQEAGASRWAVWQR